MKKNVRNYKNVGVQFAYVLDCIYNDENLEMSDKEAINYFFDCFDKECNDAYYRRLYPNLQERVKEYIKGLPSCFGVDYCTDNIINIGKSWGYCRTERQIVDFQNNWFSVIAWRLIQLKEKLN